VKTGYFAQNQAELLDGDLTVFETIDEVAVGEVRTKIRDILGAFLFSGDDADKKVKVLSGGEKSRLAIIRLMLEPVNLLVLDEPTNHFDMRSKEILKEALADFKGTIIIVSHDREFLDGIVDCVYEFRGKKIKQHLGGIYDFLRKKKIESMTEYEKSVSAEEKRNRQEAKPQTGNRINDFEERKEINRNISRLEKSINLTEKNIEDLECEIFEIGKVLSSSEILNDSSIFESYDQLKEKLRNEFKRWENEHTELEKWKSKIMP